MVWSVTKRDPGCSSRAVQRAIATPAGSTRSPPAEISKGLGSNRLGVQPAAGPPSTITVITHAIAYVASNRLLARYRIVLAPKPAAGQGR